jgi:hypothetical protein
MVGRRREAPDAGEPADREHQRTPAQPASKPSPGFLGFLDVVLGSELKTRRLGYLVWQFAGGISFVLIALIGLGYIISYHAPIGVRAGIGLGSIIMVTTGGIGLRHRRAKRLVPKIMPPTEDHDDENLAHS